ncbi:MAG: hypothetical protein R2690_08350 [Acidimicrobiales bacterium]
MGRPMVSSAVASKTPTTWPAPLTPAGMTSANEVKSPAESVAGEAPGSPDALAAPDDDEGAASPPATSSPPQAPAAATSTVASVARAIERTRCGLRGGRIASS